MHYLLTPLGPIFSIGIRDEGKRCCGGGGVWLLDDAAGDGCNHFAVLRPAPPPARTLVLLLGIQYLMDAIAMIDGTLYLYKPPKFFQ